MATEVRATDDWDNLVVGRFLAIGPDGDAILDHAQSIADSVPTAVASVERFDQVRSSGRQGRRWSIAGWTGSLHFVDVPIGFLPWLTWAGRLGVGDHRNAGAGLWTITL